MKYDKNRLIKNIYYLARSQGLKIGELESGCEVSTGYLARLRQDQRNIAPGVDFLMKVSAWLSVSVDALLLFDFTSASSEDTKLFHFVEKLSQDTECRKLVWQRDPALNGPIPVTSSATSAHPLFDTYNVLTEEELKNRDPSDESTLSLIYFRSPSHPDRRDIELVDILHCAFTPDQELYFTATVDPSLAPAPNGRHLVDLELVAAGKDLPVPVSLVCMNHEHPGPVDPIMVRLYTTIKKMVDQSRLSPEAATLIDKYLGIK